MNHLGCFFLISSIVSLSSVRIASANKKDDIKATRLLVQMLGDSDEHQTDDALKILGASGQKSRYRLVASQVMAVLDIKAQKYSEAWKQLKGHEDKLESAPASLSLGHETLKLWLLIEANRQPQSDEQFRKVVKLILDHDISEESRLKGIAVLGKLMGICDSLDGNSTINSKLIETASKALNAQLTPMAKTEFNRCLEKSHNLFNRLSQYMETLEGLNKEQSNELLTAINADMIQAKEAVGQCNSEIDEQKRNT